MARPTKAQLLEDVHAEALADFDLIQEAVREEREQCLADRRFFQIAGAQYEGDLSKQFENRPMFEFNRTHLAVLRVINEYRNNRITVDFQPKDGQENDTLADTCDGLYRADEQASGALEAYDNAFWEAVSGGIGAWRLRACYEDEEDEDNDAQRVMIEPIHDADSCVFFDLDAKRQDKGDATRCYVLHPYSLDAYIEEFDDDPTTWPKGITNTYFDWCASNTVWVCEHYRVEERKQWVYWYRALALGDDEENLKRVTEDDIKADPELVDKLTATGFQLERQKRIKVRKVRKYLLSGGKILEDCGYIAGKHIPIIMTYGQRAVIDGVERAMGHVRLAKDAQRLTNMLMSWLAEMSARFDISKPIFAPEQIARHTEMWAQDNVQRFPYLLADVMRDSQGNIVQAGPVAYTKSPEVPQPMAALLEIATTALKDLLGSQEAGEQLQPNLSGKAVELIQQRLDMQTFIYMDNMANYAMRRCGEVWLSMKKEITVEESRRMKTVASDGKAGSVVVNQPKVDANGAKYLDNDIAKAQFDVVVDVGPSSTSKRAATVRGLTGMMTLVQDPETVDVLTSLAMMNMEGEGLADAHQYFRRKLLRRGVVKPTEEEQDELAQEMANQQPDPQSQFLLASAEESKAKATKAQADAIKAAAEAKKAEAETNATLAGVGREDRAQVVDTMKTLHDMQQPKPSS